MMFGPDLLARLASMPPTALASDEPFWAELRAKFKLTPDYINLENGYYCFQPEEVLAQFLIGNVRAINVEASHYMRTRQVDDDLHTRMQLVALAGCPVEELIVAQHHGVARYGHRRLRLEDRRRSRHGKPGTTARCSIRSRCRPSATACGT